MDPKNRMPEGGESTYLSASCKGKRGGRKWPKNGVFYRVRGKSRSVMGKNTPPSTRFADLYNGALLKNRVFSILHFFHGISGEGLGLKDESPE